MSNVFMKIFGMRKAEKITAQMAARIGAATNRAVAQEAQLLRRMMITGLRDQKPGGKKKILPLSKMTIEMRKLPRKGSKSRRRRKGSTKALIDNGDLIGSIHAKQEQPGWWTVGVHRKERTQDGESLIDLAVIHEYGTRQYTITVTPKMHRFSLFLLVQGILKAPWPVGKKLNRQIPARPFLHPAHDEWVQEAEKRMQLRVAKGMGIHGEYLAEIEAGIEEGEGVF